MRHPKREKSYAESHSTDLALIRLLVFSQAMKKVTRPTLFSDLRPARPAHAAPSAEGARPHPRRRRPFHARRLRLVHSGQPQLGPARHRGQPRLERAGQAGEACAPAKASRAGWPRPASRCAPAMCARRNATSRSMPRCVPKWPCRSRCAARWSGCSTSTPPRSMPSAPRMRRGSSTWPPKPRSGWNSPGKSTSCA